MTHFEGNRQRGGRRGRGPRRGGRGGGRGRGGPQAHHNRHADTSDREFDDTSRDQTPQATRDDQDVPTQQPRNGEGETVKHEPPLATRRFAELADSRQVHPTIIQAITQDLKFEYMTPVQAATVDELLPPNRSDCLVQAKTGTGKTIAFLLPALQNLIAQNRPRDAGVSLLVISPTRELALQISTEANNLLQRLPQYRVHVAIGGTNKDREERQILGGCEILIATPGRLLDHMSNEDIIYSLRNLDALVLDEADRLLDMGFMKALRDIVGRLPDKTKTNRQGMLFSATIAPHVESVAGLVLNSGYKFISTIPKGEVNTHERVPQYLVEVPTFGEVAPAMVGCVREEAAREGDFKAILFAPTAAVADFYGTVLSEVSGLPPVSILHSRMSQNKRIKITNEFRDATRAILVATDVIARGMDFPNVTTVIQVGMPADKQSYIHRLGRTARADADGRGILIVSAAEGYFPKWTLKDISFITRNADLSSAGDVTTIAERMEEEDKARVYQAWLGFYNNYLKPLKWDKEELVRQANVYAREGLGSPDTPPIAKSTASKMGLRGVRGLYTVADRPGRGGGNRSGGGEGGGQSGGRGGGRGGGGGRRGGGRRGN